MTPSLKNNLINLYRPDQEWVAVNFVIHMTVLIAHKNIERHTAHTIVSWPNPKQWVIVHTSDWIRIIGQNIFIRSIITKEMGKLKTHSPTYCILDNWDNMLNLTRQIIFDRHFIKSMPSDKVCTMMIMRWCNVQINVDDLQAKTYPTICTHHKLHNTNEKKFLVFGFPGMHIQ